MKKMINRIALALLFLFMLPQSVNAAKQLVPVGQIVGLELGNGTVTVAAFDEVLGAAAQASGLQVGDEIQSIDGRRIASAEDILTALDHSDGTVDLEILRDGRKHSLHLRPEITTDGPRLGIYLRQGITGIGTVTYYDPQTHTFGTLGHGVNEKSGQLLSFVRGNAYPAAVVSIRKGVSGEPGQLMGTLESREPIASLTRNTDRGVFGTTQTGWQGTALSVASAQEIHTGAAVIRSTISGNTVQEYSVEILKIYPSARDTGRNMLLKVTDPALLQSTGGIVQGMSGSPIIQDGKLIGAVTHVLVNDPTTGYGIFIENMLDAAA